MIPEAPHLTLRSHTSPENCLQHKSNSIPINKSMAQVYANVIYFNKIDIQTILG